MHDSIPRKTKVTEDKDQRPQYQRPRKANEYFKMLAGTPPPAMLFDEFWREGELGLLFGPSGAGKSMLAVQIAEALARGRSIGSFRMPAKRQRVLYVDLKLSDRQFVSRYKGYHFSDNLYRLRPATDKKLCEWLGETIAAERIRYVVIDELSAVRETCDGTRETLKLMRELARLKAKLDVSILVLADCREPRNGVAISERDLMRSRILCDAADSVFAIAADPSCPYSRNVVQTRSPERPAWTAENAPLCWIERNEDGLPGLVFEKRFRSPIDDERKRLICEIRRRWNAGESFRKMAADLGISSATASRLFKKWRPDLEPKAQPPAPLLPEEGCPKGGVEGVAEVPHVPDQPKVENIAVADEELPEWEEAGYEKPEWLDDDDDDDDDDDGETERRSGAGLPVAEPPPDGSGTIEPPLPKPSAGGSELPDTPRSILLALGFRRSTDKNGREIFIERESEEGTRLVWYRFDRKNQRSTEEILKRIEFKGFGTSGMSVDGPICLFNTS